jgi:ABC-2 type transport system ATP-binding protein
MTALARKQATVEVGPHAPPSAIAVENIVKRYGTFEAVKGITFEVADGEIFGLLGPNGAGKSTLIRMMTTLIPVTEGRALVAGHDVEKEPNAVRHMIGVIPQALTSDQDLTVEENLSIYAKLYGVPKVRREKNIAEVLEAVDLTKWRQAQTKTLSGGMRRRLEIARGLVHDPRIFFLDEPTTGLHAEQFEEEAQPHHAADDALHGRGRPALRSHCDCRSRKACGAGHAGGVEAERAGIECGGSAVCA